MAFHADDVGLWASGWAVDDVVIASAPVPVLSYALFLDEEFVDSTSDTTYTFQNLVSGQDAPPPYQRFTVQAIQSRIHSGL